jgi:hypothetical protein
MTSADTKVRDLDHPRVHGAEQGFCTSLGFVATERVNLALEQAALTAARAAALRDHVSLSEWLSKAAWERAVAQAAQISAEQDRRLPEECAAWADAAADRVLGQDAA